jgi:hypothetical protein
MGWQAIAIKSGEAADGIAERLLEMANEPSVWKLQNLGSEVFRVNHDGYACRFVFSPHAAAVFQALIAEHSGGPCDPPLSRQLARGKALRMAIGYKTHWQSFAPAPSTQQKGNGGIARSSPRRRR